MNNRSTLSIILVIVIIITVALASWLIWRSYQPDGQTPAEQATSTQDKDGNSSPPDNQQQTTNYTSEKGTSIAVTQPLSNGQVSSPLTVSGTVPGSWSFEATFTVRILDAEHKEVATAPATLDGDWMTESQVPFLAQLEFDAPATNTGYIVLEKSNPSDLPENADKLEIPIRF